MKAVCGVMLLALAVVGCGKRPAELDVINETAKLGATSPYAVMEWTPISTSVNRGAGTMSTLFASSGRTVDELRRGKTISEGDQLALVTWLQREDPHWFGAQIPGKPLRVEIVSGDFVADYMSFTGSPLRPEKANDAAQRMQAILAMKAALTP